MRKLLATTLLLITGMLVAHEEFQILGKVTKTSSGELEVKTPNGKLVSLGVGAQTAVLEGETKGALAQIKKGQNVVVTAFGDSYDDLGALQVRIVKTLPKGPARVTPVKAK